MAKQSRSPAKPAHVSLRQRLLLAAVECSGGDLQKTFSAEDLVIAAWRRDPLAWGLRGHETEHPDSERVRAELDRVMVRGQSVKGGMAGLGLLEKVRQRTYRLTAKGLTEASKVEGADISSLGKADRALANAISTILAHPVFLEWLRDRDMPKYFRDAGHFWGIAAGTPPGVIRTRMNDVDNTLAAATGLLDERGSDEIASSHGRWLFERADVERAAEFQSTLKLRFAKELAMLNVVVD